MIVNDDTDLGGAAAAFPATRFSLVRAAGSPDAAVRKQALDFLVTAYWKPVYKYLRCKWGLANEDAKDQTQAFFALAVERGFFESFDPTRARFRTFVRVCADNFVSKERRSAGCLKRGGALLLLSLDFDSAEGELSRQSQVSVSDPEDFFRQEWLRELFALAVDDLRRQCLASGKDVHFKLFERHDLDGPNAADRVSYSRLAEEYALPVTQVTNYLAFARRQFRQLLLDRLRSSTGNEEEYQHEVRCLFGGDAR
jgi:DNA-directed RNA polymerase specialized sigma24 family protein